MFVFSLYYANMVVNLTVIHHRMGIRGGTTFQKNIFVLEQVQHLQYPPIQ
jgi:hypothetical protein